MSVGSFVIRGKSLVGKSFWRGDAGETGKGDGGEGGSDAMNVVRRKSLDKRRRRKCRKGGWT